MLTTVTIIASPPACIEESVLACRYELWTGSDCTNNCMMHCNSVELPHLHK
ncbi:hypothetical protein Pan54_28200 [Rubinisphaera italica]|uniref:Uncharacterized protein n=1 Tax=Rubinisphaera italica TaxID=2527969 RepID=A0A5C5XIA8_9PLAN|nr:hypothetical protein Pan54_28200 [Rubinisphaera italica]